MKLLAILKTSIEVEIIKNHFTKYVKYDTVGDMLNCIDS